VDVLKTLEKGARGRNSKPGSRADTRPNSALLSIDSRPSTGKSDTREVCLWRFSGKTMLYSRDGCYTPGMDAILQGWMLYSRDGCYTPGMDVILQGWMLYSRDGCYTPGIDCIDKTSATYQ